MLVGEIVGQIDSARGDGEVVTARLGVVCAPKADVVLVRERRPSLLMLCRISLSR